MKYIIKQYPHIKAEIEQMDIDSLLRAVLCPDLKEGEPLDPVTPSAFAHPVHSEYLKSTNHQRKNPALVVSDMEYGAGNVLEGATMFPSMWAAAESGDPALAYKMGEIAAKEATSVGYHWTFGPCVDIMGNKDNPIVNLRTAGNNADAVIEYCGAYMEGLQDNGLIATLKHFPGDGYCQDDQHITTAINPLSKEEWDDSFGHIYKTLIDKGTMAIMPGHIALPAYDELDEEKDVYPPATVSKNLLTGLLKEKLGFEGIIVSDAVNMTGFCGYMNLYQACASFLEAGGDCLLFMHDTEEYLTEMKKWISKGVLTMETLKNRAYRMACFAYEYFEKHPVGEKIVVDRETSELTAKTMVDKSVKVFRNRAKILPYDISKNTRIAHTVLYCPWVKNFEPVTELTEKLSAIAGKVDEFRDPGAGKLLDIAKSGEYDLIICSVLEEPAYGLNVSKLCGPIARNMMNGWMRYNTPVVFVSYYTAFFGETFKACADTLINTYGYTKHTINAVINRLTK